MENEEEPPILSKREAQKFRKEFYTVNYFNCKLYTSKLN